MTPNPRSAGSPMGMAHAYPLAALLPDYGRAVLGVTCCGAPLLFVGPGSVMFYILLGLTGLFVLFGLEVAGRHALRVVRDGTGVIWQGWLCRTGLTGARRLDWGQLKGLDLRYFSAQRDGKNGWLQLSLTDHRARFLRRFDRLRVNSSLDGFDDLLGAAVAAARSNQLELSAATRANLVAGGYLPGSADLFARPPAEGR